MYCPRYSIDFRGRVARFLQVSPHASTDLDKKKSVDVSASLLNRHGSTPLSPWRRLLHLLCDRWVDFDTLPKPHPKPPDYDRNELQKRGGISVARSFGNWFQRVLFWNSVGEQKKKKRKRNTHPVGEHENEILPWRWLGRRKLLLLMNKARTYAAIKDQKKLEELGIELLLLRPPHTFDLSLSDYYVFLSFGLFRRYKVH